MKRKFSDSHHSPVNDHDNNNNDRRGYSRSASPNYNRSRSNSPPNSRYRDSGRGSSPHDRRYRRRSYSPEYKRFRRSSRSYSPEYRRGSYHGSDYNGSRYRRYSPRSRPNYQRKRNADLPPAEPCKVVSVFNLDKDKTDEQRLHDFFSKFGKVERVDLIKDKRSNHSKGFGFVYFASLKEAIEAKEKAHDLELDGNIIRTDYSRTPRAHSPTPGHYMGHRGSHNHHLSNH